MDTDTQPQATGRPSTASSVVIFLLFVGSGAAALIYEIVWQQLLQLVIGSSTVSLGVLLGTFMGGMCLGSLYASRLISARRHPLRVYAALELAIGAIGLLLLAAMPLVARVYFAWGGIGVFGLLLRAFIAALCLIPPTLAMGATLPAVSRSVEATPDGTSWLGIFYAGNIAGAVFGSLLAGFYLLRVFDMNVATYVAVAFNVVVAGSAWVLAGRMPHQVHAEVETRAGRDVMAADPSSMSPEPPAGRQPALTSLYICIALSGFCALAAEVVWTRMLSLIFAATVYTFSIILAVFLIGLGIGSGAGAAIARRITRPRVALGWCQMATVAAMAWSAHMLAGSLPFWPINTSLATSIWFNFQLDFVRALWAILPAPILWGASFPLALAVAGSAPGRSKDTGQLVGRVYAANTLGAIVGALGTSLVLVAWMGSQHAQQVMAVAAIGSALLMLWPEARSSGRLPTALAIVAALAVTVTLPRLPAVLVEYGRNAAAWDGHTGETLYVGEGLHASIAVTRVAGGVMNYHNAGKIQASSQPPDMRLQRMLGHLTTIVPRSPKSVLVIGCGAGVTAGAVSVNPNVEHVTIVEIEPLVPKAAEAYFGPVNHDVIKNPKVTVVIDDARHFLMTTKQKFDAITSDPLDPWVKGAATLYTEEFFETAREHLNPGGVMTLFVQLYESSPEAVKSEVATFFTAFPNGLIFGNTFDGRAIDTVLVGQAETPEIYVDDIDDALRLPSFKTVARSLGEIGFYGTSDLFGNYAGRARDLKGWMEDAEINRDRNLRLQYLAGFGVNQHAGDDIYRDILNYRVFPDDIFYGSDAALRRLRLAIEDTRE